jgi:CheY-like chemotaxis protein
MSVIRRAKRKKWTIVVAEDDDDYAILIERALAKVVDMPIWIRRARDGDKAITLLRERVPDLLLLDLKMPRMSGHDALEQIRGDSRLCSIPVAVLTSSERDEDVAKSYGLGGNHFIVKPDNIEELQRKLRNLLENLPELGGIRRGSMGTSATAVSAVDPDAMLMSKVGRWVLVLSVLVALYFFGRILGAF